MDRTGYVSSVPEPPSPLLFEERPLTAEDCAIGEVIAGKYLVEGVIGRGSMGVVVRATHLGFDELVALKFIRPEVRQLEGIVSRFAREAKASVRIRNEHAVNVLDIGVADPIGPFFVMEYLEGINLEELVDSQGAFDVQTAVRYVLEACEALAAAHALGIIHRDIKPQNMFLAWQGRLELIKLLDFGISKAALQGQVFGDDLSISERDWVMGTPLYMSPEQLRRAPDVDERTDIWSLGAVLYELLCGRPLFSGNTQTEVCQQVMEVGTRPLRVDVAGVPAELWDIIERCLSPDKERRYPSVAELGQELLPFAPITACLHVARARALLGLEPIEFVGFEESIDENTDENTDEDIEDIDVDPIEEPDPVAPPLSLAATPGVRRRFYWVELALPLLACAVGWIGYRQWQLSQATDDRSGDAIQTVALALSRRADCPTPAASSGAPPAAAAARARQGEGAALEAAPAAGPDDAAGAFAEGLASAETSAAAPGSSVPAGPVDAASDANRGAPAGVAAAPPSAAAAPSAAPPPVPTAQNTRRSGEAQPGKPAPRTTPRPEPAPVPAAVMPAEPGRVAAPAADARSAAARRVQKPRPESEPKLEFRLIDEQPRPGFGLVPAAERASVPAPSAP